MERELSFEKTPMVHVKMHRPHSQFVMPCLPCINPRTDYEYDFDLDREDYCSDEGYVGYNDAGRICCVENNLEEGPTPRALREVEAAEGIDFKAEEFIAKFYQQMKLQRQISNLGYYETRDQSNS
ncbi:hypothetical protein MLD38_031746 [Melastoma candidum]|nr:hypothetical protein MLD38_031746 [Melastoma candidum]